MSEYKIRNKKNGSWSKGMVNKHYYNDSYSVTFSSKSSKIWKTEKLVTDHLIKAVTCGIDVSDWEVVEVTYNPTKSVDDWIGQKGLLAILKHKGKT